MSFSEDKIRGGIFGLITGDALGVPVEFSSRDQRQKEPVETMLGNMAPHYQPAGTWSDDSSTTLATMDSLLNGWNPADIMERICRWMDHMEYTAGGSVFDLGNTTHEAVRNYEADPDITTCGCRGHGYNGNGSLMRILPVALWAIKNCGDDRDQLYRTVHTASALTHAHPISMMACGIYTNLVEELLHFPGGSRAELTAALQKGIERAKADYLQHGYGNLYGDAEFGRRWRKYYEPFDDLEEFRETPEAEIRSGSFTVDTLKLAVWCLLNTDNYHDCVLEAVNLGNDTDTNAAVTGGLAGLLYGLGAIPAEWMNTLARKSWLDGRVDAFTAILK